VLAFPRSSRWSPCGVGLSLFSCRYICTAPVRGGTHFLCGRKESKQRKRLTPPVIRCPPIAYSQSGPRTIRSPALPALVTQQSSIRFALRAPSLGITWYRGSVAGSALIASRPLPSICDYLLPYTPPSTSYVLLSNPEFAASRRTPPCGPIRRARSVRPGGMTAVSLARRVRGNRSRADRSANA
jgi:hypothetical protein